LPTTNLRQQPLHPSRVSLSNLLPHWHSKHGNHSEKRTPRHGGESHMLARIAASESCGKRLIPWGSVAKRGGYRLYCDPDRSEIVEMRPARSGGRRAVWPWGPVRISFWPSGLGTPSGALAPAGDPR
jgi:hypothetical protein